MNHTVEEITLDPTHGILAPRAEITTPESRPSYTQMLIQHLQNCKPETNNQPQPETWEPTPPAETPAEPTTEPEILSDPASYRRRDHFNQIKWFPLVALKKARHLDRRRGILPQ